MCLVRITSLETNYNVTTPEETRERLVDERVVDVSAIPEGEHKVIPGDGNLQGGLHLDTGDGKAPIRLEWEWEWGVDHP